MPTLKLFANRTYLFFDAVRFQESIFALPFAYTGMLLAAEGLPSLAQFSWITIAMISARTLGMSANRIIDRRIDSQNPRTSGRHLPAGLITLQDMATLLVASMIVFIFAASQLNSLALSLSPLALAYLVAYPYAKRFTWASSFFLGCALAIAPSAAWIGVTGNLVWQPVLLSCAVAAWACSFDILYHTQDRDFYLRSGLHSVAQRFGINAAIRWTITLDAVAVACLVALGIWMEINWTYFIGCAVAAAFLSFKYRFVTPNDLSHLNIAFMRINACVSSTILAATLTAILLA